VGCYSTMHVNILRYVVVVVVDVDVVVVDGVAVVAVVRVYGAEDGSGLVSKSATLSVMNAQRA